MQVLEVSRGVVTWENDYDPRLSSELLPSTEVVDFFIRSMPVGAWITFLAQRNERGRQIGTKIYRFESLEFGGKIKWVTFDELDHLAVDALAELRSGKHYRYGEIRHREGASGGDGFWYLNYQT